MDPDPGDFSVDNIIYLWTLHDGWGFLDHSFAAGLRLVNQNWVNGSNHRLNGKKYLSNRIKLPILRILQSF